MPRPKQLRWQELAREEFLSTVDMIAADNPRAAARFQQRVERKVGLIAEFPTLGTRVYRARSFRFITHGKYVIYYSVGRREVVIRAFRHGSQPFRRQWLHRED